MNLGDLFPELVELRDALEHEADALEHEADVLEQEIESTYDEDIAYIEGLVSSVLAGDDQAYRELRDIEGALSSYGEWRDIAENALADFEDRAIERELSSVSVDTPDQDGWTPSYDREWGAFGELPDVGSVGSTTEDALSVLEEIAALSEIARDAGEGDREVILELASELYERLLDHVDDRGMESVIEAGWSTVEHIEGWARGEDWVSVDWDIKVFEGGQPEGRLHSVYDSLDAARATIQEIGVDAFDIWEAGEFEFYIIDRGTGD